MKIYSMTATFGKLNRQTLTLKPGLNIIEAPNEWGKSTWRAFLINMLYGLETRERTTATSLADKEHYAPWSGAPMSGRIDLNWNGRDITIERNSRGRTPFGEFLAYETASGLDVPELNGANCGMMLLGVERSVFVRAGFLTLNDLPVTQDDALRRRLNNLVTTGDESGAGDKLEQKLKDLKNKCRSKTRTGLLPQAEAQRSELEDQLNELLDLTAESENLKLRQAGLESQIAALENHDAALRYASAKEDAQKVALAQQNCDGAQKVYDGLQKNCDGLPSREQIHDALAEGQALQQELLLLQKESSALPPLPQKPAVSSQFENLAPQQAVSMAQKDFAAVQVLEKQRKKHNTAVTAIGISLLVAGFVFLGLALADLLANAALLSIIVGACMIVGGIVTGVISILRTKKWRAEIEALYALHPGVTPALWVPEAERYAATMETYEQELAKVKNMRGDLDNRQEMLNGKIAEYAQGEELTDSIDRYQQMNAAWEALSNAHRDLENAKTHLQTLRSMARTAEAPKALDQLTYSEQETADRLQNARFELRQLQLKLGQYQGRCEALGQEAAIRDQLRSVNRRIEKLEDYYNALDLAQQALSRATAELQRRFAPRIAKRAQELFQKLTHGRYNRLVLSEDLTVKASATDETAMQNALWCSDGTADQLYLALRLAVSEELTPNAPLILDDALVRFDDDRLKAALNILCESAENKQVILFTCQKRENALLEECK